MKNVQIPEKVLIDWIESLGYVFHDVDINYEDDEAREQVEGLYEELKTLATHNGIDYIAELRKRGVLVDTPESSHCGGSGVDSDSK